MLLTIHSGILGEHAHHANLPSNNIYKPCLDPAAPFICYFKPKRPSIDILKVEILVVLRRGGAIKVSRFKLFELHYR